MNLFKKILLVLLTVAIFGVQDNVLRIDVAQATNGMAVIQDVGTNHVILCWAYAGFVTNIVGNDTVVRWSASGANAGMIHNGTTVRLVGGWAQRVGSFNWVQVDIIGGAAWQHNGWLNNRMWIATTRLPQNQVSAACR